MEFQMTRYATLRDRWFCYRDLRGFGMSHLDSVLLGFGWWVYFPRRYPEDDSVYRMVRRER